jgi:DNA mismatch endonuclease (patch repair protein)
MLRPSDSRTGSAPSWASSLATQRSMQSNRSRDTGPELAVRRLLHRAGYRYRVNFRLDADLRRTADIVFTRARVAVFIDGCFWHRCPEHGTEPRSNSDYWGPKLDRNVERDLETTAVLVQKGWRVLRFWEHESPERVADRICQEVATRRE